MNIRVDEETRRELKEFARQVGIPVSALVKANIRQMLRNREVTYSTDSMPTPHLQKLIKEAEADHAAGRYTTINSQADLDDFFDSL